MRQLAAQGGELFCHFTQCQAAHQACPAQALALPGQSLEWDDSDDVQVATEELTREELMRIWDTLPMKYSVSVPYVVRGVRVALQPDTRQYAPVVDRSFGFGGAA